MDGLEILTTRIGLNSVFLRLQETRKELEEKRPNAKVYIEGSLKSENELVKAIRIINEMERELIASSKRAFQLEKLNLELRYEIEQLKNELKFKDVEI